VRVVGADEILQYARAAGGVDPLGAVDVLERDRQAGERACVAAAASFVSAPGLVEGEVTRPLGPDEGVQLAVHLRDAVEEEARQLD
jgi:hypothetical protein